MSAPFKEWMEEQFERDELKDIAQHGASAGWSGLIYYRETSELYERFEENLWEMLGEDADAQGYKGPLELIATFGGASAVANDATFKNLIVWYAAERTASELVGWN